MDIGVFSGWVGAILVLVAYYMVSSGKAQADSNIFQAINIIGAGFLIYYTYCCEAYASMVVNVIWVIIGLNSFITYAKIKSAKYHLSNIFTGSFEMKLKSKLICAIISSLLILSVCTSPFAQTTATEQTTEEDTISEDSTPVSDEEASVNENQTDTNVESEEE